MRPKRDRVSPLILMTDSAHTEPVSPGSQRGECVAAVLLRKDRDALEAAVVVDGEHGAGERRSVFCFDLPLQQGGALRPADQVLVGGRAGENRREAIVADLEDLLHVFGCAPEARKVEAGPARAHLEPRAGLPQHQGGSLAALSPGGPLLEREGRPGGVRGQSARGQLGFVERLVIGLDVIRDRLARGSDDGARRHHEVVLAAHELVAVSRV
jgi:hypothetical protein